MFNKSARNFNMPFGRAARCTIVEVDEIVPTGSIDPDQVHLPSVYVQRVFKSNAEKPIAVCHTLCSRFDDAFAHMRTCLALDADERGRDGCQGKRLTQGYDKARENHPPCCS